MADVLPQQLAGPLNHEVRRGRPGQKPRVEVIGIGVQKSATSWLFNCLLEHPGLRGSIREDGTKKELNFFNHHHEYGYDWYEAWFRTGSWKNLEFSVLYFHSADVPGRIARYNPEARLLLAMRNPVERALSQYRHEVRRGRLAPGPDGFWGALERNPSYIEQGRYATHLERWLEHFDVEQFHIIDYDDIRAAPERVLRDTFRFLNVDPDFEPEHTHERINRPLVTRSTALQRAVSLMSKGVRLGLGDAAAKSLRASTFAARVRGYNRVEVAIPAVLPIDEPNRTRLAEAFAPELQRLGALLGRDYSHWR